MAECEDYIYIHTWPGQCARFDTDYSPDDYDGICCTNVEDSFVFVVSNDTKFSVYQTMYPNWMEPIEEEIRWVGKKAKITVLPGANVEQTQQSVQDIASIDWFQDRVLHLERMPIDGSVHNPVSGAVIVNDEIEIFTEKDPTHVRLLQKRCSCEKSLFRTNINTLNFLLTFEKFKDERDLENLTYDLCFDGTKFTTFPDLKSPALDIFNAFSEKGEMPDFREMRLKIPGGLPLRFGLHRSLQNIIHQEESLKAHLHENKMKEAKGCILTLMDVYKACGMKISREMADLLFHFGECAWREGDFPSSLTALTNSHKLYEILLGKKHPTTIDAQCKLEAILCSADCIEPYGIEEPNTPVQYKKSVESTAI